MISPAKVEEVRRLLAQGNISQRQIARQLSLSRGVVGSIASGRRPDYSLRTPQEPLCLLPAVRCPGCGGFVHPPCRLCRVRVIKARELAKVKARRRDLLAAAG
jgi:hypothetical protein